MHSAGYPSGEKRKYIRLDTVFPVQLRLESLDGSRFLSQWLQGFTNNVSKGGICLAINNFDHSLAEIIKKHQNLDISKYQIERIKAIRTK